MKKNTFFKNNILLLFLPSSFSFFFFFYLSKASLSVRVDFTCGKATPSFFSKQTWLRGSSVIHQPWSFSSASRQPKQNIHCACACKSRRVKIDRGQQNYCECISRMVASDDNDHPLEHASRLGKRHLRSDVTGPPAGGRARSALIFFFNLVYTNVCEFERCVAMRSSTDVIATLCENHSGYSSITYKLE